MNPLIQTLQPILDNASYIDLFWITFLLVPAVIGAPLVIYWVLVQAVTLVYQFFA